MNTFCSKNKTANTCIHLLYQLLYYDDDDDNVMMSFYMLYIFYATHSVLYKGSSSTKIVPAHVMAFDENQVYCFISVLLLCSLSL